VLTVDDLVVTLAARCGDRSDFGRTSLQKLVYLCSASLRWRSAGHNAHYYGPFSRQLERTVRRLTTEGLLAEYSEDLDFVGSTGYRARRYRYHLTPSGADRAHEVARVLPDDAASVSAVVAAVEQRVGGLDQRILSLAAKVHYIVDHEEGAVTRDEIVNNAKDLGWLITQPDIDKVVGLLEDLNLVRLVPAD
jgi:uncharacterized protein YwgA